MRGITSFHLIDKSVGRHCEIRILMIYINDIMKQPHYKLEKIRYNDHAAEYKTQYYVQITK